MNLKLLITAPLNDFAFLADSYSSYNDILTTHHIDLRVIDAFYN